MSTNLTKSLDENGRELTLTLRLKQDAGSSHTVSGEREGHHPEVTA